MKRVTLTIISKSKDESRICQFKERWRDQFGRDLVCYNNADLAWHIHYWERKGYVVKIKEAPEE
jgi:hypothetical protein